MIFASTDLPGVFLIEVEPHRDERGFFARTFSEKEFAERGLRTRFVQCSISYNHRRGTVRGLHYQTAPHEEAKLVSCIRGAVHDVVVDLRPNAPTHRKWLAVELQADRFTMVYVPEGCAHGFQTLEDDTTVYYQISESHHPESARGVRWDDPTLGIRWPLREVVVISQRDRTFPLLGS